jgi:hypothetical protein
MTYTKWGSFTDGGAPALQADFFNRLENYLRQVSGGSETSKYILAGSVYTTGALISLNKETVSQGIVISSVTTDTADVTPVGGVSSVGTGNLSSGGFQIYSLATTGPNVNARAAGNWTATF